MITFTRCAFMAKQACATFSQVVQKITPPIANNFLKFFFVLFAMFTFNAATAWAETTTLTNANIASLYNSSQTSWRSISNMTDINGFKYNAYAILNKHSNATSTYKFLQIKKYASNVAYYVQVPQMPGNITTISMTVSSSQKPMTDGGNTYTLYFSNSSKTSTTGNGVASGTGDKSVTIDCSTLNLKEGYITANGSVRIWDITVTYESATPPTPAKTYDVTWMVNGEEWDKTEGVEENTQITNLPTEPTDNCGNKVFQGWTDKPISGTTNTKPSILFKDKSPEITEELTTFYAVFATETNSGSGNLTTTFTPNVDDLSTGKNGITIKMSNTVGASGYYQIYKSSSMTIESEDVMTSFTLTCTAENQSKYGPGNITFTEGTYSYSNYTGTWTGNATSLTSSKAAEQLRIKNIVVTTSSVSTTISDYTTSCSRQPIQLAKPTGLEAKEITSNSAILSWDEVENKSSYKVTITDDHDYTETFTVMDEKKSVTNLSPNTTYYWTVQAIGDGTNYTDSETSEQSSFNTLVPCTDAVTISKGTSDNGSFKLDKTGEQSTCNGAVTVTLSDIQPAAGYKFSAITQSGINTGVTIDNNNQKVTYAQHTIGKSTINVTFIELPKYTVSFSTGTDNPTQADVTESVGGQGITLPVGPAPACTDWTFAGWAEADATETTTEPTLFAEGTNYKPSGNCTLYAVYSTTAETTGFTGYEKVTEEPEDWSGKYLLSTGIYTATGAFDDTGTKGHLVRETYTPGIDEKTEWEFTLATVDNTRYSILFPDGSSYLGYASSTNFARSADVVPSESVAYLWTPSTSGITNVSATSRKIADNGSADFRPYSSPSSSNIVYLYKRVGGGSTTIYNSNPTCLVPVWNGATIDKTSFTVNCGERSPMTGQNGAAKITFPTEDIYNFTKDITIEASAGFIVSTSQSVDANYKSSVSLSPLVGTTNANTFYEKPIYVRAEAPAMSEEDLSGTITIKNNKGETLQTFSVTADVTCTQYTLTLVDRGVSTEQPTKYYAGETINEAPADPEGVCTDPIHYVFDGWAEETVAAGATTYTKVTFPYTMPKHDQTLYAVYRYVEEGSGDGNYYLVENDLGSQWAGEYLIVSGTKAFDGSLSSLDVTGNNFDVTISNKTIESTDEINQKTFTIKSVEEYYTIQSKSGKYIGAFATGNLNNNTEVYDDRFYHTLGIGSPNNKALIYSNKGDGVELQTNGGRFRYYTKNNQTAVYLYKKADGTTYYTTSPICGPHLAITEGKEIYVTGGNAGGTRDLVIAQQKVSYKATRLNVGPTSQVPDVKVATNGITVGGVVTSDVKVAIDQNKEQQTDGTYTITGTITVQYQPSANNKQEDIQVQLAVDYNSDAKDAFIVHARSLPQKFVIVAKQGDKWYALNGDMSNGSSANPANGQVTLDNNANPTKATYAPCNTIYTLDGVPNTGDRTRVRFQGTDGAWLWASSGTNVGIQNNVLKTTPEGSNKAYNWKLETEDNITYKFHNDNSSRLLGLSGEKFGMYANAVQEFRILPYEAKCLYNYAPSNLKVSVLKGTYVTLTWDAVAGATKYQYSTNGTTWTDAGTDPTVTINGLEPTMMYTIYIRAYHEDAGVSQECIDYAEITFTTADCDDVPTNITYSADLNSITVSWTAAAPTATIKLYLDENGEHAFFTQNGTTSPWRISTLSKNTTYYLQIFSDGTCASPIIPVKTEDVEVDIVEWQPQGIIVDINTDETIGVTLENEVSYGSGLGTEATELFFSKYYEASYNVKLVAIYNGTKNIIDLTDYTIQYGKTEWENNYITLKDFGATKGQIQPGEEIILYSYTENNADDKKILDCVHDAFPDGNWVRVTSSNNDGKGSLSFAGDKTIILCKTEYDDEEDEYYDYIIDVIGALKNDPNEGILPTSGNTKIPSWGDNKGWVCETGLSIADDSQIGISTNRCLLIRNNTVTSGDNAVIQNIDDFVTLCSEWKGAHMPDNDIDNGVQASCDNFAYVGTFDYSDYYTKYVSMGDEQIFDENARNADGTVTIPITDLYKQSCRNIRVKLTKENGEVLSDREYKVPIMITSTQGTDGQAFIDLRQNLATKEVDGEGNVIATHPLSLEDVREICKTCDVVVRDNAILTKADDDAADDHPEVRDVYVYQNSSLIVPAGTNYTINNLSLRRNQDAVASVSTHPDALKLPESAAAPISLDFRLSAENWHWFTLPYNCNINEVTWIDGTPAQYNVDWFLMTYDGATRAATQAGGCWKAYTGTTINAGDGFIIAINGNINNSKHTYELRFPMSKEVLVNEGKDKTVDVRAWGVETNIRPNHKGWNLVGNPYLAYYQRNNITNFEGLRLGQLTGPDPQTGYWEQTGDVPYVVVPVGAGWIAYEQVLASETDLLPFTAYFVQVGNDEIHNSNDNLSISFDHTKLQLSATPMPASIIQRSATEASEPVIVGVSLTNAKGESDKTSLIIDNQYTNEYEMHADFFKWFGDYYKYYTKPVLYTVGADQGKRAFNAISEDLASQPISLGMYAAQAGNYTFSLDLRSDLSKVQEVWLYDATQDTYTNLMQDSYTFNTAKTESAGRFFLSVKMAPKVSTDINNVTDGTIWATTQDHTIFVNGLLSNAQLWIYDATGKLLHTDQTQYYQHTYQVPVSGTYFVRVQNTMQTQTIKVVVE